MRSHRQTSAIMLFIEAKVSPPEVELLATLVKRNQLLVVTIFDVDMCFTGQGGSCFTESAWCSPQGTFWGQLLHRLWSLESYPWCRNGAGQVLSSDGSRDLYTARLASSLDVGTSLSILGTKISYERSLSWVGVDEGHLADSLIKGLQLHVRGDWDGLSVWFFMLLCCFPSDQHVLFRWGGNLHLVKFN